MAIDYSGFTFGKGRPRVAEKQERDADTAKDERAARQAVDRRDGRRCFFPGCKSYAREKHHILASSVRGRRIWRTDDLLSSCTKHHRLFKAGLIGVNGNPDVPGSLQVYPTKLGMAEGIVIPTSG